MANGQSIASRAQLWKVPSHAILRSVFVSSNQGVSGARQNKSFSFLRFQYLGHLKATAMSLCASHPGVHTTGSIFSLTRHTCKLSPSFSSEQVLLGSGIPPRGGTGNWVSALHWFDSPYAAPCMGCSPLSSPDCAPSSSNRSPQPSFSLLTSEGPKRRKLQNQVPPPKYRLSGQFSPQKFLLLLAL